ncbi:MAG TPA: hypothetical protein DCL76_06840 [Chloroflexi bacterium]|nr:hypothetical protein [Chloroflexota bacterium]
MSNELDNKIMQMLDNADFLTLATSVDNNSSASNVYFANDGYDIYFFTFNPTRKAEQIRVNPCVQCVVRPDGTEGIKELQIEGIASRVSDEEEANKAYSMILNVTEAFKEYMEDDFLKKNNVIGYYKIKPTVIKYVDFFATRRFEWKEFPQNNETLFSSIVKGIARRIGLYLRAVRAPFFTATIAPICLGASVFYYSFGIIDWQLFWWTLFGGILAHAGTNVANDYSDHLSRNDEVNKLASPFNGGSRMIQAGLMSPVKVFIIAVLMFIGTILIGLNINAKIHGEMLAISPLLWFGVAGILLGIFYTAAPLQFSYKGFGDIGVMLGFGPIMAMGSHYVQQQALLPLENWQYVPVLLASVPVAILIGLVLFINGFQDYQADKEVGKRTWIVRLSEGGELANYRKPFYVYKFSLYFTFSYIAILGLIGIFSTGIATPWILLALLPSVLAWNAINKGEQWLDRWLDDSEDRDKLPYELLIVNVSTIGTHFSVALLLTVGYFLGNVF